MLYLLVFLMILPAYAEQIPDYDNPYAPIYTDRAQYSWTDKIRITIVAPSWNENVHGIDSIGDEPEHAVKISTPSNSLKTYRLTETAPNSGVFTGEVTLTGFSHDVDGDGVPDTNPRTMGGGPTDGLLEVQRDDGITISFEFADGVVLTGSTRVIWNVGQVEFPLPVYPESGAVTVRAIDPDMNLNPESPDQVTIDVTSDTDSAGVSVSATETADESGIFEAVVTLTATGESSGNRLHAVPGDSITAIYRDRTLPSPFSILDEQNIEAHSYVGSDTPQTQLITLGATKFADPSGRQMEKVKSSEQIQMVNNVQNNEDYPQQFTCIIQISDASGAIVSLAWVSGQLTAGQRFDVSQSWIPAARGDYTVETFVWRSLDDPRPLSETSTAQVTVE